ncbi:methyl-accepting chemotaxis protein [Shewanella sp. A3A]|nr:methyl-accepting chemotaxis protein [Shewanella ferrihydritica]
MKARLLCASLLAVFITCAVLIVFSINLLQSRAEVQTRANIQVLAETFASLIGSDLNSKRIAVTSMAHTIEQYPQDVSVDELRLLISHTFRSHNFILSMYGDEQGLMVRQDPEWDARSAAKGYDPRQRAWYQDGTRVNGLSMSAPYVSDTTGDFVVTLAHPVKNPNGSLRGMAGSNINVSQIAAQVRKLTVPGDGYTIMVDNDTRIISHPDSQLNNKYLNSVAPELTKSWLQQAVQQQKLLEITLNGATKLVYAVDVPHADWAMVFVMDRATIMATYTELTYWMMVIGIGVLLVFSIILTVVFRRQFADLERLNSALSAIADGDGDLTVRVHSQRPYDEIGQVAEAFNRFVVKIHQIMTDVSDVAASLGQNAQQANNVAKASRSEVDQQLDEVTMVATAVTEMASATQEIASNAELAAHTAQDSVHLAAEGERAVTQSRRSIEALSAEVTHTGAIIEELNQHAQQISTILATITGVAEQTNLLALNAAIEAARAGEHGRGFAVVADEVRVLSQRTHGSTQEIQTMIEALQATTKKAVHATAESLERANESVTDAEAASDRLSQINTAIAEISDMARQIAAAAEEQTSVTAEINRNTESIREVSTALALQMVDTEEASNTAVNEAKQLGSQVNRFKL